MAEPNRYDLTGPDGVDVFRNLPEGTRVTLASGAIGEITANPRDGAYVLVRFSEHPHDAAKVGEEEYVFFNEVRAAE